MDVFLMMIAASMASGIPAPASQPVPIGSPAEWITQDDYSNAAVGHRLEGTQTMRLTVDAQGRVIGCTTELSSGSELLDQTGCALVKMRGRYQPARDGEGHATTAQTVVTAKWIVPKDDDGFPIAIGPFSVTIEADVLDNGHIEHCSAPSVVGLPFSGELICGMLLKEMPVAHGNAASKLLGHHIRLRLSMDLAEIKPGQR